MARTKVEYRPARLRCTRNGHVFTANVLQRAHYLEELSEPFRWTVENTQGVTCPQCGSPAEAAN